jgi:hypothetical protein
MRKLGEEGQSTLEFALTLMLLMAFILFYTQLSLIFAWGNYVHYATFMSARAYASSGPSKEDQIERAKAVILRSLKMRGQAGRDRMPMMRGVGGEVAGLEIGSSNFSETDPNLSWLEGVRYTFRSKVFVIPFGRAGRDAGGGGANRLTLTSESWLGRDPSYSECQGEMDRVKGIFDNGC